MTFGAVPNDRPIFSKRGGDMIGAFIQNLLGEIGRAIYAFYLEYSLYINGFIILYGLSVFLAHRCFYATLENIKNEIKFDDDKKAGKDKLSTMIERTPLDWNSISHADWFPFIALPGKIIIHFKSRSNLQKAFSKENLMILLEKGK
jgi:hypothetical protein